MLSNTIVADTMHCLIIKDLNLAHLTVIFHHYTVPLSYLRKIYLLQLELPRNSHNQKADPFQSQNTILPREIEVMRLESRKLTDISWFGVESNNFKGNSSADWKFFTTSMCK